MKLKKPSIHYLNKNIIQKSIFIISLFALGLIASGHTEKQSELQNLRNPATENNDLDLVKKNSTRHKTHLKACEYNPQSHKVCSAQIHFE